MKIEGTSEVPAPRDRVWAAFLDPNTLAKAIRKDKRFSLPGFGTFTVKRRAGRVGRNPQTGAEIKIAPTKTVGFKPAPELKKGL